MQLKYGLRNRRFSGDRATPMLSINQGTVEAGTAAPSRSHAMNIFKNLLFLQGYLADPSEADREHDARTFAPRYGNRVESKRRFAPLGHARMPAHRRTPPSPVLDGCGCG
jgi:hypothetical protein